MNNPFMKAGEMLPVASINSVYIDDTKAYDLFRPALILQELIQLITKYGLHELHNTTSVLMLFDQLLHHESPMIQSEAISLANKFGDRLASVLTTLLNPSNTSIANRDNWTDIHWSYWQTIRQIYLVGGLTSPLLTQHFYQSIIKAFKTQSIDKVTITFIEGSQNMGTRGLASIIHDGDYLLFDFGQTSIKRARALKQQGKTVIESYLEPIEAKYLFYKNTDQVVLIDTAHELDNYIINVIQKTISETGFTGDNIYMSIANYVSNGKIYSARGGYGKLAYVADNYQQHIERKLSKQCNHKYSVRLFHDTSAMALLYRDHPNTAVISLGTAFGVAFPHDTVYS